MGAGPRASIPRAGPDPSRCPGRWRGTSTRCARVEIVVAHDHGAPWLAAPIERLLFAVAPEGGGIGRRLGPAEAVARGPDHEVARPRWILGRGDEDQAATADGQRGRSLNGHGG